MAKKIIKNEVKSATMERPIGVTILAILGYIGAAFTLLIGLAFILGSAAIASLLSTIEEYGALIASLGTIALIILGIIFIPLAILNYFIARGLWKGKNWARIIILVFTGISAIQSLFALPFSIVNLAINGLIIWYLGFNKPVIAYFK